MKRNIERPRRDREPRTDDVAKPTNGNLVFGVMPVLEALRSKSGRVERLSIAVGSNQHRLREILDLGQSAGLRIDRISSEQLDRITGREVNHQGVVAFVAASDYTDPEAILGSLGEDTLLLLLDGVEDPRNLGAILRTAECAGIDGIFIPERRAVGLTETVAKSAAGATEHIKVAKVANLNRLIEDLKKQSVWVVGASADAQMEHTEWDWTRASALVLGGEGKGLHRLVAENCDALVKIPMYGKIDSLNVSVAAGVILFEIRRQREKFKTETGKRRMIG
jgi:23S rRNA (guanosine2251-2'-O)-methyltransferase